MAAQHHESSHFQTSAAETKEIIVPEGYEIIFYTLRRQHDDHLESFCTPIHSNTRRIEGKPIPIEITGMETLGDFREDREATQSDRDSHSPSPNPSIDDTPSHSQMSEQQTFDATLRAGSESVAYLDNVARERSVSTLKRHEHARDDDYTDVCGIASTAISTPVKKYNHGKGEFCCPRCESNFTRPKSVKDHFPYCILKCGNPQALRYTDHPSMMRTEAAIQRRARPSRESSMVSVEGHNALEAMNNALARTTLRATQEREAVDDRPHIKCEILSEADTPLESIEKASPEPPYHVQRSLRPKSSRGRKFAPSTPDWQIPQRSNSGLDSSSPTTHSNPWNIGIPGSAAEHVMMDSRATAPFEGWLHVSPTPEPRNSDGTQGDGLDGFMDRRSCISDTPMPSHNPHAMSVVYEEIEMEE